MATGRIADGSSADSCCSDAARGFSTMNTTTTMAMSFAKLLAKLIRLSTPTRFFSPLSGFNLEKFGASLEGENSRPCWIRLPATPAAVPLASTIRAGVAAPSA